MTKWSKNMAAIRARVKAGYEKLGKRVPLTDTGQVSTSEEAKRGSGDPDLIRAADLTQAETLINNFIPVLERGVNTPICARFNVLVESGRISCSDPNLLNPPAGDQGVRECFVPNEGNVFINADLSVIELRALAQINLDWFGQSALAEVFKAGGDPHNNLLIKMGLPTEEDAIIEINGNKVPARRFAKMNNFGFASGLGAETFVDYARGYGIIITLQQGEQYRREWLSAYPEMRRYFDKIGKMVPKDNDVLVRQHRSGRIRGGVRYTSAVNTMFQGLTADGGKDALWAISRECYLDRASPLFGSRPVIHLYDENLIETPEANATQAALRMCQLMKDEMQKLLPDVPVVVGKPKIMRRWSKDAKSPLVDGKLAIWDWSR